jgi:RNA-directed DNA polymerase
MQADIQTGDGTLIPTTVGMLQGSIVSLVLANTYLNEMLDQWFMQYYASHHSVIVRYADDGVFLFQDEAQAMPFVEQLYERVAHYSLELNQEKTRIINFRNTKRMQFDFLGFTFYWEKASGVNHGLKLKPRSSRSTRNCRSSTIR